MPAIGDTHRQRGTGLLVRYRVVVDEVGPGRAAYFASFTERDRFVGGFSLGVADGELDFDPDKCRLEDAVRSAVTRYIDGHELPRGEPLKRPHPSIRFL